MSRTQDQALRCYLVDLIRSVLSDLLVHSDILDVPSSTLICFYDILNNGFIMFLCENISFVPQKSLF